MIKSWRLLAMAAALNVTAGAGIAAAQTIIVRHAPPGETIEAVLNATKVATAEVTAAGDATLSVDLNKNIGTTEIDANIFIDVCDKLHRVIVVERAKLPDPQEPGCARRDIPGLYWVRQVNTLVIDVGSATPTMLLIRGSYSVSAPRTWTPSPTGLVLFGSGSFLTFRDAAFVACGSVTSCSAKDSGIAVNGGLTYWFTPFLGAEVTYLKPRNVTSSGGGDTYHFNGTLESEVATVAGKLGVPLGALRLYGQIGRSYHWGKAVTTETIDAASQTFELKTEGWGWSFGGGGEVWLTRSFALYAELAFADVKGADIAGGEGRIDDRVRSIGGGVRVHIGR